MLTNRFRPCVARDRAVDPRRSGRIPGAAAADHPMGTSTQHTLPEGAAWPARDRARMPWRPLTRGARLLPDFLILGGQRCGSTSLYTMLCGHPQVMQASHKEVHFFDNNHLRGEDFYRRVFPLRAHAAARERYLGNRVVTGEA